MPAFCENLYTKILFLTFTKFCTAKFQTIRHVIAYTVHGQIMATRHY